MKSAGIGAGLIAGRGALVWLGSGFFIVQEGQQAVVTTFGKYSHTVDAGFQWRAAVSVPGARNVSVTQLRSVEVGRSTVAQATGLRDSSMLTQDENIVDIRFTVQYRLKDARDYLFENRNPDEAVVQAASRRCARSSATARWTRCCTSSATPSRRPGEVDPGPARPLKAGIVTSSTSTCRTCRCPSSAGGVQRRRQGRRRPRPLQERRPGLRQRRHSQGTGTAARLRKRPKAMPPRVVAQAEGDAQRFRSVLTEYQKAPGSRATASTSTPCSRSIPTSPR
jgi:membrane protease subunit HflK